MLKETEETVVFFVTFLSLVAFQLGGGAGPPWLRLCAGTDANAHRSIWGFSDINPRGDDLLPYCVSADLSFCNVGNKPTFRIKTREEVFDLILVNRCAWDRIIGWHVSVTYVSK